MNLPRRHFLQSTVAALGGLVLPRRLFAGNSGRSFHFIHVDTLDSWSVADPAAWCLQNAREPILRRAREGLAKLTVNDGDRIVRLVVKRCRLNLLELHPQKVVLQHWAAHRADLRPFFKQHGLTQPQRRVVLWDRKDDYVVKRAGDDFLFGEPLLPGYPLGLFVSKYKRRFSSEADDWQAAPGTWSGFAWDGLECNRIPWASLKSAWRRGSSTTCPNCDTPTLLVNFGHPWVSMFNRSPRLIHICSKCCRSFTNATAPNMTDWLKANLDRSVWPACEMVWDRSVKWDPKV